MLKTILRKEHKNQWEKRTPLTPSSVKNLLDMNLPLDVESSDIRIFDDSSYINAGAKLFNNTNQHQLILGIKEPPIDSIQDSQVHLCFSHTLKGQDYNMPLLQRFIDKGATLLDYEPMADESGKRTIAFGEYAGIAGAIDTLWIAGQKLALINRQSGLSLIKQTIDYSTIETVKHSLASINCQKDTPVRILIVGTGNVGRGTEQVCKWLGLPKLDIDRFCADDLPSGSWYTVASSKHIFERIQTSGFDKDEYLKEGKKAYKSRLESYLGRFDILLQTAYWTDFYPRHLDNQQILNNQDKLPWVIGDVSCDIDGSFVCTQKASTIDVPAFSYHANDGSMSDGMSWEGVTVMSIDNLPCELSLDSSEHFTKKLEEYVPHLMQMDLSQTFDDLILPDEIKKSVIVYKGQLTEDFQYLSEFL